ncbi:MAG: DNA integrity scanning protein DisA nucleotide-binding domain protein [Crocosphaera sp.]
MEDNIIDPFMWEYQEGFQRSINYKAEKLFDKIDPDLQPKVFLLGVLINEREDKHPIYLEPEDCGYKVSDFTSLHDLAIKLEKLDPEKQLLHSHPFAQVNHDKKLKIKAYRESLKKHLSSKKLPFIDNIEIYISYPILVDSFLVFVVLTLRQDTLNKYYSLVSEKEKLFRRVKIDRSLIESLINVYLKECSKALKDPEQDMDVIQRNSNELIREAGEKFMYTVGYAGKNHKYGEFYRLYDACNMISSLKYEGEEGLGKIVIAEENHPNIKYTLQLKEPIHIQQFRKVRKFLQLAKEDSLIISDAALIYGIGELRGNYNPRDESLFIINFVSHYKWEVLHNNQSMMIVEYQQPRLPKSSIVQDKFYSDLRRIFERIEDTQLSDLWDITIEATKQKHGTMLVITDKAKEESERLGQQCFPLTPLRLNTSIVQQITSIDGSVLIDRNAVCYAVGVILDGNATNKGDASRGARYNSAIRYYEQYGKNKSTVLVIISEDGMIDIIPNLKPQIKHSEITKKIDNLQALSEEDEINRKNFNKLVNFFREMKFYLSSSECEQINKLRKKIDEKIKYKDPYEIRVIYPDLKPNEDMNETYYLDE